LAGRYGRDGFRLPLVEAIIPRHPSLRWTPGKLPKSGAL